LARDLLQQEVVVGVLKEESIKLISVQSPESFSEGSFVGDLIRQIMGAINQFQRCETIQRLKQARDNKARRSTSETSTGEVKVTGKKSALEGHPPPQKT